MIPFIHIGSMQLPTFFLVISLSLSALVVLLSRRVDTFKKDRRTAFDIALLLMVAGFVGGRLMHVFYEEWAYYRENPLQIFYFWNGGFTFLGGVAACLMAGAVYAHFKKISFALWADFFTPLFSLGHALGRIGCFLAGCCYGTFCTLPWAQEGRHPTALYLVFGELLIFAVLLALEKKRTLKTPGSLLVAWLALHSGLRFWVEFFRDDFRGVFVGSFSIAQVISLVILFIAVVFFFRSNQPKS